MARVISKTQVSDPGPSWPSCFSFPTLFTKGLFSVFKTLDILAKALIFLTHGEDNFADGIFVLTLYHTITTFNNPILEAF